MTKKEERTLFAVILVALAMVILLLSGCDGVKRLTNTEDNKQEPKAAFYVVSCCRDTATHAYPSFLPQSQIDLCETARVACNNNDCKIGNDIYLPMHEDCGRTPYKLGDSYYPASGY